MLIESHSKYKILDHLLLNNYRFSIYKLPSSNEICFILQTDTQAHLFENFFELTDKTKGFVISPFSISSNNPIVIISPNIVIKGEENILKFLNTEFSDKEYIKKSPNVSKPLDIGLDSYSKYKSIFEIFHDKVLNGSVSKLVLSRTKDFLKKENFSIASVFEKALDLYSDNFVYLCNTLESGAWLGCSPEILLSGKGNHWKTHALAGTQKIGGDQNDIAWDNKNKQEQTIVFDYVQEKLRQVGVTAKNNITETILSGNLAHLRSEFMFDLENAEQIAKVLTMLHPTPAVCGYPKDIALDIINTNEDHDRSYYSGFIGPYNIDTKTDLYVNLRCMQIFSKTLRLYAGGGIMPQSEVELEWQETEYKLQTIAAII